MKLTPLLLSVALLAMAVARAESGDPFAPAGSGPGAESAPGGAFGDFCRANPSAAQPIGSTPLWFEALLVEIDGDKVPLQNDEPPTAEMLARGKLVLIEVRANSSASGGSIFLLDRAPDGRLLDRAERREVGTQIFIHLPPDGISAAIFARHTKLEAWVASGASPAQRVQQPVYATREINTLLTLGPKWLWLGGGVREEATRLAGGAAPTRKSALLMFCLLLPEDPTKSTAAAPSTQ